MIPVQFSVIDPDIWSDNLSVLETPAVAIVSSRRVLGEDFRFGVVTGILLIGAGLAPLFDRTGCQPPQCDKVKLLHYIPCVVI